MVRKGGTKTLLLAVLSCQSYISYRTVHGLSIYATLRNLLALVGNEVTHLLVSTSPQSLLVDTGGVSIFHSAAPSAIWSLKLIITKILPIFCMVIATAFLWNLTASIGGDIAALVATVLTVATEHYLRLCSSSSRSVASFCMLVFAIWCVCQARQRTDGTKWMLAASAALILSNALAYESIMFDPVAPILAILVALPVPGGKYSIMRGMSLLTYVITGLILLAASEGYLVRGARHALETALVLHPPWSMGPGRACAWIAVACALACVTGWGSLGMQPNQQALVGVLLPGGLLLPLAEAGILPSAGFGLLAGIGAALSAVGVGLAAQAIMTSVHVRVRSGYQASMRRPLPIPRQHVPSREPMPTQVHPMAAAVAGAEGPDSSMVGEGQSSMGNNWLS
jgi:hypothetical protein